MASQHYVLIFEKGEQQQRDEVLKLHPDNVADYFDRGFQFVVKSSGDVPEREKQRLREQFARATQETEQKLAAVNNKLPSAPRIECRVYTKLKFAGLHLIAVPCCDSGQRTD